MIDLYSHSLLIMMAVYLHGTTYLDSHNYACVVKFSEKFMAIPLTVHNM